MKPLKEAYTRAITAANKPITDRYIQELKRLKAEAMKAGALEDAVAIDKEITSFSSSSEDAATNLKKNDPIVGRWNYNNGNICEYTSDGFVTLNAKTIGIWRRKPQGGYIVAFTRDFAGGSHDDLSLDPSGKFFDAKGRSSTIKVDRVR